MKELNLSNGNGLKALVDESDYAWASQFNWRINSHGYVIRAISDPNNSKGVLHIRLHRQIMGCTQGDEKFVDHIDGDKLNNRRSNLRICSNAQNLWNRGKQSNNTSGFKGVSRKKNRWSAQIKANGKTYRLGVFDTPEEASAAYCKGAAELHGEFANAK